MKKKFKGINYSVSAAIRKAGFVAVLLVIITGQVSGQKPDYRVVFDLTSRDTADYSTLIRWIREITVSDKDARIEVVLYGGSLDMVVKQRSTVADAVSKLLENKNVQFDVCAQAMRNHHIEQEELISGVGTVPDGIYEIISKQRQGWGYIKAGH
jgi:intracellular sulfur oxidation DsrE/DsrF family protein